MAAAALVAAELATGPFYQLMLALGAAAAALAAHAGLSQSGQLLTAALVGGGAVGLWVWQRSKQPKPTDAAATAMSTSTLAARCMWPTGMPTARPGCSTAARPGMCAMPAAARRRPAIL